MLLHVLFYNKYSTTSKCYVILIAGMHMKHGVKCKKKNQKERI